MPQDLALRQAAAKPGDRASWQLPLDLLELGPHEGDTILGSSLRHSDKSFKQFSLLPDMGPVAAKPETHPGAEECLSFLGAQKELLNLPLTESHSAGKVIIRQQPCLVTGL